MIYRAFPILVITILMVSCFGQGGRDTTSEERDSTIFERFYPDFNTEKLRVAIISEFADSTPIVDSFYVISNYEPIWSTDFEDTSKLERLISIISFSDRHGIDPESFKFTSLRQSVDSVKNGHFSDYLPRLYETLARIERLASEATIDYCRGMAFGFTDPVEIHRRVKGGYTIPLKKPDSIFYSSIYNDLRKNPFAAVEKHTPTDSVYASLLLEYDKYSRLSDSTFIKFTDKKQYVADETHAIYPLIAKQLMITGDLAYSQHADSLYSSLNPELLGAITQFCKYISYPDTMLNSTVVEALNRPMDYYSDKLKANLERRRWRRADGYSERNIEVNVASFLLEGFTKNYSEYVTTKVCVGISGKHNTPLLQGEISYLNLNPTWNVPRSIASEETYYKQLKDSTFLKRNSYRLRDRSGAVVDPSSVSWSELSPDALPFSISQDPGAGNALGRIKFMFQNPHAVYLHDTPTRRPFGYRNRAVSHGCVRLEMPMEVCRLCISNKDSLYFDRILISIDRRPESTKGNELFKQGKLQKLGDIIDISPHIRLWLDYYTAYLLPGDSKLYLADDVYGLDLLINQAIDKYTEEKRVR